MAYKVLYDSQLTLSHGRVPGQDVGKSAERGYCGWRTLADFFPLVHVAMGYQSVPLYESLSHAYKESFFCVQMIFKLTV